MMMKIMKKSKNKLISLMKKIKFSKAEYQIFLIKKNKNNSIIIIKFEIKYLNNYNY